MRKQQSNPMPEKNKGVSRILKAMLNSIAGFKAALKHEEAFQQEVLLGLPLLVAIPFLPASPLESALLATSVFLVWIVELLNSGLEWTIDYISLEKHPFAKKVKDMGSAAVLVSLLMLLTVWLLILTPYLLPHFTELP